jgi:hypothetical protein
MKRENARGTVTDRVEDCGRDEWKRIVDVNELRPELVHYEADRPCCHRIPGSGTRSPHQADRTMPADLVAITNEGFNFVAVPL